MAMTPTVNMGGSSNLRKGAGPSPSLPLPFFLSSLPPLTLPLEVGPLNQLGVWGSAVSSPSG